MLARSYRKKIEEDFFGVNLSFVTFLVRADRIIFSDDAFLGYGIVLSLLLIKSNLFVRIRFPSLNIKQLSTNVVYCRGHFHFSQVGESIRL